MDGSSAGSEGEQLLTSFDGNKLLRSRNRGHWKRNEMRNFNVAVFCAKLGRLVFSRLMQC